MGRAESEKGAQWISSIEVEVLLRRRSWRSNGGRGGRQAEVVADAGDDGWVVDELDAPHLALALGANQNFMTERARLILHLAQQLRRREARDALAW